MKTLISSAAAFVLLIIPLTTVEAAQESRNFNITPTRHSQPILLAGPFDAIRRSAEELNDSIHGVQDTVDEVNRVGDNLKGEDTQPPCNPSSTTTPATTSAPAQGSPDNPIPITSNEVQTPWSAGKKVSSYYYTFVATPGELRIIFDVLGDQGSGVVTLALKNEDWKELASMKKNVSSSNLERQVERFRVDQRRQIILQVDVDNDYSNTERLFTGTFRVQLEGALIN